MMNSKRNRQQLAILAFALVIMVGSLVFGQENEIHPLLSNQTIEREMTGAETHRYKFELKKDELFQVCVEQKGVDVWLKLTDANNQTLSAMDSPNGTQGAEVLSFAAAADGNFLLEVSGFDAKAAKGIYTIRRETARTATAQDRRRIEIEHVFVVAVAMRQTKGQEKTALLFFETALRGWQELKDDYLTDLTWRQVAQLRKTLRREIAAALFAEAKTLYDKKTAESLRAALPKFEEARRLYKEEAEMFSARLQAAKTAPISASDEANFLSSVKDNKLYEGLCLFWQASIYEIFGEKSKALELHIQKLEIAKSVGDKYQEAFTVDSIAQLYEYLGNKQKALELRKEALQIYKEIGNKTGEGRTLNRIGDIYGYWEENQKALDYYRQALQIFNSLDDKERQASTLELIASVFRRSRENEKALDYYSQSLVLSRTVGNKKQEEYTLFYIGAVYAQLKDKPSALKFYNEALAVSQSIGDKTVQGYVLSDIGNLYFNSDEKQKALDYYNQALMLHRIVGDPDKEELVLFLIGKTWHALGNSPMAIFYGKQAVNKCQEMRRAIQGLDTETQKTYLKTIEGTYRELADILVAEGRFAQAEQVLRMLKEEEYFDFVRRDADEIKNLNSRVALDDKEQKLIARYTLLADRIGEIGLKLQKLQEKKSQLSRSDLELSADEQKQFDEYSIQIADANAAFKLFLDKELVAEFKDDKDKVRQIEVDRSLQDKLRKWGAGTVALTTVVGEDRYRVILTTPTVQIDGKTEIKAADLNKKIFAFRAALQNPQIDPRPLGKELYDILIKPIEKDLQTAGAKTLVWSLDGTLRYAPLAALSPDGQSYLVEKYQTVIITPKIRDGLSDEHSNAVWRALGLGVSLAQTVADPDNPTANISFNQLPGTRTELTAIVNDEQGKNETGVLAGRRFLDETFTTKNLIDSLSKETADGKRKYTVIHVASHFRLGNNYTNSFLLLGNNQILSLEAILSNPNISFGGVDLITLSACNTAFADESNGKEVDSLAEAIQAKSGKAILATLWSVADESTSLLMSEFYRLRKENPNLTKAEAMQAAQKSMIAGKLKSSGKTAGCRSGVVKLDGVAQTEFKCDKDAPFSHPYFWSPFVLIGNWR